MKRDREITVRVSFSSDAMVVNLSVDSLRACSALLGDMVEDLGPDVSMIDVPVSDHWTATVFADLMKTMDVQGAGGSEQASDRIFDEETSLFTPRVVDLYHALDKYDMRWAMEAMEARIVKDLEAGGKHVHEGPYDMTYEGLTFEPMEVFDGYREHPRIARILIGREFVTRYIDDAPRYNWIRMTHYPMIRRDAYVGDMYGLVVRPSWQQLKMMLLDKVVKKDLIFVHFKSYHVCRRSNDEDSEWIGFQSDSDFKEIYACRMDAGVDCSEYLSDGDELVLDDEDVKRLRTLSTTNTAGKWVVVEKNDLDVQISARSLNELCKLARLDAYEIDYKYRRA